MKLKALMLSSLITTSFAATAAMDVMTHHPYARATPPNAPTSAVFVELMNHSEVERTLVAAQTPAAGKVELHDVIKEGDLMKMRQVKSIVIPANDTVTLKPGSLHIMLFDLVEPLKEGNEIEVELEFANGDKQTFTAPIKKVMGGMKHHH